MSDQSRELKDMVDEAVRLGQTVSYVAASPHMAKVYGAINVLCARLEAKVAEADSKNGERIQAAHRAMVAERERDEARVLLAHAEADAEQALCITMQERDEARARLAAAEAALLEADRMREGYEAYEVVGYDTARAAWEKLR